MTTTPSDAQSPDWSITRRCHDWKNYVDDEIREMWDTFTPAQRDALARSAEAMASTEEWE